MPESTPVGFDGRVAIVTGAGGGLGRSYALELARRGASVVVNDLGGDVHGRGGASTAADAVVAEIESSGGTAVASADSVASRESAGRIVGRALEAFGRVDIVVNNAGILRDRSFANLEPADIEDVIATHLMGAFWVTQPAFKVMKEQNYGRLVHVSSNSGLLGNFGQSNYGAAKAGLVGLSNALAIEGARYGIQSNVVAPVAKTRMTEEILGPLAEHASPDEVTPMVVFLASEANPFTHEIFSAGGGRFARFFIGVNRGWISDGPSSVESLAGHLDEVRDISDHLVLGSAVEELQLLGSMLLDRQV